MSNLVRIALVVALWVAVIVGLFLWFGGRETTRLTIGAGPLSGESFELATAIARVVEDNYPNIQVDVYETQGSVENVRLVGNGRIDLAAVSTDAEISRDVRVLATLYSDAYQLAAAESSGIRSVTDLIGRRVAIPPTASGQNEAFWFLMEHYGLDASQLTALPMSDDAANFAMRQGQVDAVFRVRVPGTELIRGLVADLPGVRLIPIDQPGALALKQPAIANGTIPRGAYRGNPPSPSADLGTVAVDRILVARSDLDEDLAYTVTQLLFEQRAALARESNLAGLIRAPDETSPLPISVHPGAVRYYDRERPSFIQENSRLAAAILYVCALMVSVFIALRTRIKRAHRVRMTDYTVELIGIADQARHARPGTDISHLQEELVEILRKIVYDVDVDRITSEEFDHFSFTWQAVNALVSDKMKAPAT